MTSPVSEPMAIIGMGCRFPEAPNSLAFWRNQCQGRRSFAPVDPRRWDHSRFLSSGRDPDGTPCDRVAHLDQVDLFAASHFKISPRRAEVMDPQQRLLLEVTWETLLDAGLQQYDRSRSGIFIGCSISEYRDLCSSRLRERQMLAGQFGPVYDNIPRTQQVAPVRSYTLPGNMLSMNASVVAQAFDWGGPGLIVDGSCSSSLLALHQACSYLAQLAPGPGPTPVALVAGVYLNLLPDNLVGFSRIGALAQQPSCSFDISANGFAVGEGVGAVLLKPLKAALQDGDRIYATIRGTACNSDGTASSLLNPKLSGQVQLLRQGLHNSGVEPSRLAYLECHGTATPLGDRTELQAWQEVLPPQGPRPWIGSVKANLGHSLAAAGMAGLLRASLAVYHGLIPPQAGWQQWHPKLEDLASRFGISNECQPFPAGPRWASVTSFAFGGLNAIAILEGAPAPPPPQPRKLPLLLSAPTPELLQEYAQALARTPQQPWNWTAYTLSQLRPRLGKNRLLWAESWSDFQEQLQSQIGDEVDGDFSSHFEEQDRRVADLPPPPLLRQSYWVVNKSAPGSTGLLEREVREWLSRQCGCPPQELKSEQLLVDDLGLDSLALRDLVSLLPPLDQGMEQWAEWTVGQLLELCRLPDQPLTKTRLSPATHPFLLDHALERTMLLPLASGLDFLAWSQSLQPPWSLEQVSVHRGLMFREATEISLERQQEQLQMWELRAGGRKVLALSAQLAQPGATPEIFEIADQWPLEGQLERFYEQGTFHGSRLQGISSLLRASDQGVVGLVKTSVPRDWVPNDPRLRWQVDPLVVDSCLQLALYWVQRFHGRPVLPNAIGEISLLTHLATGLVEARVISLGSDDIGPSADVLLLQNGRLVGWLRQLKARWVQSLPARSWQSLPGEWTKVQLMPEVMALQERLQTLGASNPYFQVPPPQDVNFCHYNYLGLAHHPKVLLAATQAVAQYGCSAKASRLVGGEIPLHRQLEQELAQFLGQQDALVLVGGHATNTTFLSHWMQSSDLILHDSLSHNSLLEGAQASQARRLSFPHNDMAALEAILRKVRTRFRRVLLVVEGIYSMDGDIAPLPELLRLKHHYGCLLMVDEAHSLGVLGASGRGICEHFGIDPVQVDLLMGTLSKTLASCGGYLAGSQVLIDYLRYTLPGFVYSVGLAPPLAASARAALQVLRAEPERVEQLRQLSRRFWEACQRQGLPLGTSQATPVLPIILGDSAACTRLCQGLAQRGIQVKPIVYPAVEESAARLRFFLSSEHQPAQLDRVVLALTDLLSLGVTP